MLKPTFDTIRTLLNFTDDTKKNKDNMEKTQARFESMNLSMQQVISDADADRRVAAEQRENLLLRLQMALKDNEQRALPSGSAPQNAPETEAQIAALEKDVQELKQQVEALKKQ